MWNLTICYPPNYWRDKWNKNYTTGSIYARNDGVIQLCLFWHSFMYRDLHVTPEAVVDLRCELKARSWRGVLDTTLCDKVCQWLGTGRWVCPGTPISSINKTNHHDITEILLKMVLNTITLTLEMLSILCQIQWWPRNYFSKSF